ncbi:MAG TPA: hypothetical protein VFI65_03510 [Streptosporangiaceae bacterium]|nr:hypothetical protein [Streptosporangiaceae bacterium]
MPAKAGVASFLAQGRAQTVLGAETAPGLQVAPFERHPDYAAQRPTFAVPSRTTSAAAGWARAARSGQALACQPS